MYTFSQPPLLCRPLCLVCALHLHRAYWLFCTSCIVYVHAPVGLMWPDITHDLLNHFLFLPDSCTHLFSCFFQCGVNLKCSLCVKPWVSLLCIYTLSCWIFYQLDQVWCIQNESVIYIVAQGNVHALWYILVRYDMTVQSTHQSLASHWPSSPKAVELLLNRVMRLKSINPLLHLPPGSWQSSTHLSN